MKNETKIKPVRGWAILRRKEEVWMRDVRSLFVTQFCLYPTEREARSSVNKKYKSDFKVVPVLITPITKRK